MLSIKQLYRLYRFRRAVYRKRMEGVARVPFYLSEQDDFAEVRIRCEQGRVKVDIDPRIMAASTAAFEMRLRPVLATVEHLSGKDYTLNVSLHDGFGGQESQRDSLCFSDCREGVPLLVDPYFFLKRGYRDVAKLELPAWQDRAAKLVWRGSTTARVGSVTTESMQASDPQLCQRSRVVLLAQKWAQADVQFFQLVQSADEALDRSRLSAHTMMGEWMDSNSWCQNQFGLDIDGNVSSWSLFLKLARMGCCIFKVGSPGGMRQWFTGEFEPMRDFIPIKADLSDFDAQLDWAFANSEACESIANSAYQKAVEMTQLTELKKTAVQISAYLSR